MKAPAFSFDAIGTTWSINIADKVDQIRQASLLQKIQERIEQFDKVYSRFRNDSLVMKMSRALGAYVLPMDAEMLLNQYKKFYDVTEGKVTPLIGDVLVNAGYNSEYSLVQTKDLEIPKRWENVIEYQYPKLIIKEKTILDFGAGGKGYLVDIISELLEKEGIRDYCIDAGGDMLVRNQRSVPLIVGLEDPEDDSKVIGRVSLSNQSLAGSAGNRRVWGKFHHIIDPNELSSPRHILGLWVIANTTILADLLATALFFSTPERLHKHFDFECLIMRADRSVSKSTGFEAELFTTV